MVVAHAEESEVSCSGLPAGGPDRDTAEMVALADPDLSVGFAVADVDVLLVLPWFCRRCCCCICDDDDDGETTDDVKFSSSEACCVGVMTPDLLTLKQECADLISRFAERMSIQIQQSLRPDNSTAPF